MLMKVFEKIDECKIDKEQAFQFPFMKSPKYEELGKDYFKLMQADAHELPFKDNSFDTVVDSFTL